MKKCKTQETSGITLIALVVTIIILIILATVSINLIFNEGGLINRAEIAKQIYENNAKNEEEQMNEIAQNIGEYMNGNNKEKVGMTISEAKAAVTSYSTLKQYIGTKITDYNPTAGGKWRIFYYDEAGEFGTAGKLYLKRDYVSNDTTLTSYTDYIPSSQGLEIMKAMNPKWRDYPTAGANVIDLENEHCVAWLCDPVNWTDYKITEADYAIGSPSVEMYMKAFNVWKTGNKDATNLVCRVEEDLKIQTFEGANGYSVGSKNVTDQVYVYQNAGAYTNPNTIETGPNNIFMTAGSNYWWLASPHSSSSNAVIHVNGKRAYVNGNIYNYATGVCPVVSL